MLNSFVKSTYISRRSIFSWFIKGQLFFFLCILTNYSYAQDGYVITEENKIIRGFLMIHMDFDTQQKEIQIYKSAKGRDVDYSYFLYELKEFAIRKDTFRIIRDLAINDWYFIDLSKSK